MSVTGILHDLKAESLLAESHILTEIADLKTNFWFLSDGERLSFGDYYALLEKRINAIPRVNLLSRITKEQEGVYTVELIEALDQVLEKANHVYNKVLTFQTYLADIERRVQESRGSFEAWYTLAVQDHLTTIDLKLPVATIKALASSEFSRLLGGMVADVTATQTSVKVLVSQIDAKKKMAQKKFDLGREQVNVSWATRLPESLGISTQPAGLGLLQETEDEEEEDALDIPYVSHRPQASPALPSEATPADEIVGVIEKPIGGVTKVKDDGQIVVQLLPDEEPTPTVTGITESVVTDTQVVAQITDASLGTPSVTLELPDEEEEDAEVAAMVRDLPELPDEGEFDPTEPEPALLPALDDEDEADQMEPIPDDELAEDAEVFMGVDLSSGDDSTATAIALVENGVIVAAKTLEPGETVQEGAFALRSKVMTGHNTEAAARALGIKPPLEDLIVEDAVDRVIARKEVKTTGFVKQGTPQPATIIAPAEVITVFDESADAGVELDEEDIEREIEADAEAAEDAAMTSKTPPPATTATPAARKPLATMEDELDDLIPTPKPTGAPAPVPVAVSATQVSVPATQKKRKPLSFAWTPEE